MKIRIRQAVALGYAEIEEYGVFDAAYPSSRTRRGRVQEGGTVCPTITCNSTLLLFEGYEGR